MSTKPAHDHTTAVVRGASVSEALANVKRLYGPAAAVLGSREVRERSADDLGEVRSVEVLVALDAAATRAAPADPAASVLARLDHELARVEALTAQVKTARETPADPDQARLDAYPLTGALLRAGVGKPAAVHLARLWAAETAARPDADPRRFLASRIGTSRAHWSTFGGCHVLLGEAGAGKTALAEAAAARLRAKGQKVLLLAVAPRDGGVIRRLQERSRELGVDGAALRRGDQLERAAERLRSYDAVLIDTPPLGAPELAEPRLRRALAEDERFHRHLVQPLDADAAADVRQWTHARTWNCDWIAVTRTDLAARPGRLLELAMGAPLPLSLTSGAAGGTVSAEIADPERLVAAILGGTVAQARTMEV